MKLTEVQIESDIPILDWKITTSRTASAKMKTDIVPTCFLR